MSKKIIWSLDILTLDIDYLPAAGRGQLEIKI